jgi:hypothetical protein
MSFNREVCLSILARAGTSCLNQWARDQHGMRMGIVTVIHTFGADIKWHPHLHLLVTEGGLSLDGEEWIRPTTSAGSCRTPGSRRCGSTTSSPPTGRHTRTASSASRPARPS